MPYLSQKIKIQGTQYDRRRKLTEEDKAEIRAKYQAGGTSQRKLAREYGVSRRLIIFVLDPEKLKRNKEARKARGGWQQYYDKDEWRKTMREHRSYKQGLYLQGII